MYPAALRKIPTQTVDSSRVLAKCIRKKATANNPYYYKKL